MNFSAHDVNPSLAPYIESIFHYSDFTPDHSIERVVPTGHIFLIFELDGITRNTYHNDSLHPKETFSGVWISGMHKKYISISAHQDSEMFVVQFQPHGAHPFLHVPIFELNEQVISAHSIIGEEVLGLRAQFLKTKGVSEKFELAEKWLEGRFDEEKIPPSEMMNTLAALKKEPFGNFQKILESYPFTQKHLINQFKKYVGLTPKYLHRIYRFNEIFTEIRNENKISWSSIAYQCGFADQSHFIKEFKHFSGFNPQEFIQQDFDQDEANFFPLDRQG